MKRIISRWILLNQKDGFNLINSKNLVILYVFQFEVSLATGLFSWSIGLFLLTKKLPEKIRGNIYFLLIFSSIQFADAILWYNKMRRNNLNYYITSLIIPAILSGQIIIMYITIIK